MTKKLLTVQSQNKASLIYTINTCIDMNRRLQRYQ